MHWASRKCCRPYWGTYTQQTAWKTGGGEHFSVVKGKAPSNTCSGYSGNQREKMGEWEGMVLDVLKALSAAEKRVTALLVSP